MAFTVSSTAFSYGQNIPINYTCEGANINPPIAFEDVPNEAKSIVLIMDDPDAAKDPKGPGIVFDHWIVYNIKPGASIREGELPTGALQGKNTGGQTGYTGPCPPTGAHTYYFRAYALDTMLSLGNGVQKAQVIRAMENHILAVDQLIAKYEKRGYQSPASAAEA
jgi:Raf kinase inhibitor-like YbhB/YbcL family protein